LIPLTLTSSGKSNRMGKIGFTKRNILSTVNPYNERVNERKIIVNTLIYRIHEYTRMSHFKFLESIGEEVRPQEPQRPQGPQGPQGLQGLQGPQGPQEPQGLHGGESESKGDESNSSGSSNRRTHKQRTHKRRTRKTRKNH
jgi:hypothetical protein